MRSGTLTILLCASLLGCESASSPQPLESGQALSEIASLGADRVLGARLSITRRYSPCDLHAPRNGTVAVAACRAKPEDPSPAVLRFLHGSEDATEKPLDLRAMHAAALGHVLWGDTAGIWLREAISTLQAAARLSQNVSVLTDLSAAYLLQAERFQSPRDLVLSVESAEQALELEPGNAAARFNLATALDRLDMVDEAGRAWREYLMVDSTSGWAAEAKKRLTALSALPAAADPPACGKRVPDPVELAKRLPQQALLLGWDCVLGRWGEAVLAGDSARALESFALASALGEALEQRRGGDATLAHAVHAIRIHRRDPAATRSLARAHREYARGRALFNRTRYAAAAGHLRAAAAERGASRPLKAWAELFRAATFFYAGDPASLREGIRITRAVRAAEDTLRHPVLAGRTRWVLGSMLFRTGEYQRARDEYRGAARFLERAGEREHLGGAVGLQADVEFTMGDAGTAYGSMHQAIRTLGEHRRSAWLHNTLATAAQAAVAEGLPRAALRIQNEGVAVAERNPRPFYAAEARLSRARLLAAAGRPERAAADVEAARRIVDALEEAEARDWFRRDVNLTEASLQVRRDPARAAAALDSVVKFFASNKNPIGLVPALAGRAEARLALRDVDGTLADLDSATRVIERLHASIGTAALRVMLLEAGREVFDRLVMLNVRAGRPRQALAYLERGRTSFAPGASRATALDTTFSAPAGRVVVSYALIGDTLLTWTLAGSDLRLARDTVRRERLLRTVERTRSALEQRTSSDAVRRVLEELHDVVLRPVQDRLGPSGTPLVVVADGEIASIPFAALRDARRGRYLVEDHSLRFASSMRDARRAAPHRAPARRALVVADPAFDRREFPRLERLEEAAAESDEIRRLYPAPRVLSDTAARTDPVLRALPAADVVHYAGHAVFDDRTPEHSFLVLARGPARWGSGRLSAQQLAAVDLGGVRLVVLSACQTLRASSARSGGFTGFSGALLSARAGGVVGSLWSVSDALTRPMMVEFHRRYRASGDAAEALRDAQIVMLRSRDAALSSPAAWAGFRYAGN